MPAYSDVILAPFEDPNTFAMLQPFDEESITDIEPTEHILLRVMRSYLEHAAYDADKEGMQIAKIKERSFQDGELDGSWTIVAKRRRSKLQELGEETSDISTSTTNIPHEGSYNRAIVLKAPNCQGSTPISTSEEIDDALLEAPKKRWRKWMTLATSVAAVGVVSFLLLGRRNKKNK